MEIRGLFSAEIEEAFGFDHSDTDDSQLIDAVEYGSGAVTFEEFMARMAYYKKELDETGSFGPPFSCA